MQPLRTPLNKRPSSYSEPLFRFDSLNLSEESLSTLSSRAFPPSADSPLQQKTMKVQLLKDEISCIVDKMKESISIERVPVPLLDVSDDSSDESLTDMGNLSMIEPVNVSTPARKSIMKTTTASCNTTSSKRVRINERVEVITPLRNKIKRKRLAASPALGSRPMAKKPHYALNYLLMLKLCASEKDPLNIVG